MRVNLGYAVAQLQKALAAAGESASDRVQKWQSVIAGLLDGSLRVGSEQEQILTTHNLASLWRGLELGTTLQPRLPELANHCFTWVCQRQQIVIKFWQAKLQALKNSAYAWRQMVFFVSMMEPGQVAEFRDRMAQEFATQPLGFQRRFGPAVVGLSVVLDGGSFGSGGLHAQSGGRRLLGWTAGRPWLLEEEGS